MNKKTVNQPETAPATALRRPLIVLLSVFIALCILTSALAVLTFVDFSENENTGNQGGTQSFDYTKVTLSDYLAFTDTTFKGLTLPGFESRVDEVTAENVKKEINTRLLAAVALTSDAISQGQYIPKYSEAIDYADEVFLYILYAETEDGERVDAKYFENAYIDTITLQIGMGYFGDEFDEGLMGLIPAEKTFFDRRLSGSVAEDDIIILSYTVTETVPATEEGKEDEVKNHKNYTGKRFDLAELKAEDAALHAKLLASYGTIGQYFSFEHEEDVDGDGDKETVKYQGMIDAVIENEHYHTFEAHLPEDYFGRSPEDETQKELNGALLTFAVSVAYTVPHEAKTADTLTLGDIATLNAGLKSSGVAPFVPSNNKPATAKEDGELTKASQALSTKRGEITKLKAEIETLERGNIATLTNEIAALEAEIAELSAAEGDHTEEIAALTASLNKKQEDLAAKQTTLTEKKASLAEKEASLEADEAAYEEKMVVARTECVEFFKKELEKTYEATVKYAAGSVVFEHLLDALAFKSLPESEVTAATTYYKESLETAWFGLDDYDKRNYRDIHQFAAAYFGYDEKEFETYEDYIDKTVEDQIKYYLLVYGIYNQYINDSTKLDAKKAELISEFIDYVKIAYEQTLTKEEAEYYYPQEVGSYVIEDARYELVMDFLAENNTIDWDTAKN